MPFVLGGSKVCFTPKTERGERETERESQREREPISPIITLSSHYSTKRAPMACLMMQQLQTGFPSKERHYCLRVGSRPMLPLPTPSPSSPAASVAIVSSGNPCWKPGLLLVSASIRSNNKHARTGSRSSGSSSSSSSSSSSTSSVLGAKMGTAELPPPLPGNAVKAAAIAVAKALLVSLAVAVAAHAALAIDPPAPPAALALQSRTVLVAAQAKFLQVLAVFRDQGLLLSLLLGLSAFFSMAETAITTLWPWKVRELAEKETEGGVFQMLRKDVTRFLTTILIGTTVANIAATALVTDAATALFGEAGVSAATGVMTVVLLILTEITPKNIAVHNATEVARIVVKPVAWLSYVLYPVGRVFTAISMSLLKLLGLKSSGEPFVTEEELKLMLRGAELSGSIEEEEQDMIENVLEIKDTYVREVMTPLVDVVAIDASDTLVDFRNLWVKHQYSRVPVFEKRIDNIVGIAFAMDVLDYVEQTELLKKLSIGRIAHKPAYFVPDSMSVWNLLREFRIRKIHMAIVLNEYGGTIGIVTLEDVVEEIVGEIFDENDSKEEIRRKTGYILQRADGIFDVDANTSIEDLAEALEVKVPEGPFYYETVSGFVCEAFGYIPRTGESIKVIFRKDDSEDASDHRDGESDHEVQNKFKRYKLEILAGNARKVGSVRFQEVELTQGEEDDDRLASKWATRALHVDRSDGHDRTQNWFARTGARGSRDSDNTVDIEELPPCVILHDDNDDNEGNDDDVDDDERGSSSSRYLIPETTAADCVILPKASFSSVCEGQHGDER